MFLEKKNPALQLVQMNREINGGFFLSLKLFSSGFSNVVHLGLRSVFVSFDFVVLVEKYRAQGKKCDCSLCPGTLPQAPAVLPFGLGAWGSRGGASW